MSGYPGNQRQAKGAIAAGVAAILSGFVVQAINVQSFASQGPGLSSDPGNTMLPAEIAGFLFLSGVILTVIGIVRYAQSGTTRAPVSTPPAAGRNAAPALCPSCGAAIAGEGRFCLSCGAPRAG